MKGESRAGLRTESENKGLNAVTTHAEAPAPEKTNWRRGPHDVRRRREILKTLCFTKTTRTWRF